jgi:hypothetical protein
LAAKVAEIALNTSGFKKTVELISKGLVQKQFKEISAFNFSFFKY